MALQAHWTQGHSATIEMTTRGRGPGEDIGGAQWTGVVGLKQGWGATYRCQGGSDYWFHLAVPTPVIQNNVRSKLIRGMLLFKADTGVTMTAFHMWDGPTRVFERNGLAVGGDHESLVANVNRFDLTPQREVLWGIGLSALFHFNSEANVTLFTGGIDLDA